MNLDRAWALTAIVLSILAHASVAMLGHFEPGKAGSTAGSLSVSVAGDAVQAAPQIPRDVPSEAVNRSESIPPSVPDAEPVPDPVTREEADVTEVPFAQEQVKELSAAKPVKKPRRKAEATTGSVAQRESKTAYEAVEQKPVPAASASATTEKSAARESLPAAPPNEAQLTNTAAVNKSGPAGRAAAKGIVAEIKPEINAIPLYHLIPKPPYPSRSRDLGEEGTVIIAILVDVDGSVADAYVSKSSGYALLDGSALSTVKAKWRFKPATSSGDPVASWVRAPVNFNIK